MCTTTLEIPPLQTVVFAQSKRAKRISISIAPFKPFRVAFPPNVSLEKARKHLLEHIDWAKKSLAYVRRVEHEYKAATVNKPMMPKAKAKQILKKRLRELADEHGFEYQKVFIKSQKTRWGSCSDRNNINLNINLVSLSQELIDYVILHELVHTRVKSHSRKFWAQLDKYVGGRARDLQKAVKMHRPRPNA
ncbi:MAG: M48 family metallopeptidase [Sedimentisphaerales bacterium]|nr:M48 family metallopeptidase [Sedimentisphaerales bacterium]